MTSDQVHPVQAKGITRRTAVQGRCRGGYRLARRFDHGDLDCG
jgi:hypothetical protein